MMVIDGPMSTENLENMLTVWEKLGPREKQVLLTFAWRMAAGQRKYGPMSFAKKDWPYEALEEVLDACVYMSAALCDKTDKAFDKAVADAEAEVTSEPPWPWNDGCGPV